MRSGGRITVLKTDFLEVPEGVRIKYQHFYFRTVKASVFFTKRDVKVELNPPVLWGTQAWLVNDVTGNDIPHTAAWAIVNPKDTPNKKLGRLTAHNRCIKAYLKHASSI